MDSRRDNGGPGSRSLGGVVVESSTTLGPDLSPTPPRRTGSRQGPLPDPITATVQSDHRPLSFLTGDVNVTVSVGRKG